MMPFREPRLADRIAEAILAGRLPPGTRLDGPAWDAQPGLSPVALREAMTELCARGLVRHRPGQGFEVAASDLTALLEGFEALGEIQALCAGLAARRMAPADLRALEDLTARMEDAEPEAFRQMGLALQDRVCRMTKNAELARLAGDLRQRLAAICGPSPGHPARHRCAMEEYRALVEAIGERNEALAATIMRGQQRAAAREVLFTTREAAPPSGDGNP